MLHPGLDKLSRGQVGHRSDSIFYYCFLTFAKIQSVPHLFQMTQLVQKILCVPIIKLDSLFLYHKTFEGALLRVIWLKMLSYQLLSQSRCWRNQLTLEGCDVIPGVRADASIRSDVGIVVDSGIPDVDGRRSVGVGGDMVVC